MRKYNIELKWAIIYCVMYLVWMTVEWATGLHSDNLENQQMVTTFILVPSLLIYILALRDKRKSVYNNMITFKQSFFSGLWLTIFIVLLSPVNLLIVTTVISPNYFSNLITYTVSHGVMSAEEAQSMFNIQSYIVQSMIGGFITGIVFTIIISFFIQSKPVKS